MKTRNPPIRLAGAKAVKVLSNGSFLEGSIKNLVEGHESFVFLEFNALETPEPGITPFHAFTRKIAGGLDKHKPPEKILWWLNVPLRIAVSLALLGLALLTYVPEVSSLLRAGDSPGFLPVGIRILLWVLFLVVFLSLVFGFLRRKIPEFDDSSLSKKVSKTCSNQLGRLFKEEGATPAAVASLFEKYLLDDNKYVIVINFVNWLFEESHGYPASNLLATLLNAHKNLWLIYLVDQQEVELRAGSNADGFESRLARKQVSIEHTPYLLSGISREALLERARNCEDSDFYVAFHEALSQLNPSETETILLYDGIKEIHSLFTRDKAALSLSSFLSKAGTGQAPAQKAERIIDQIFAKDNAWNNISVKSREMLIFLAYHHYFTGTGRADKGEGNTFGTEAPEEIVYKFLLMQDFPTLRESYGISEEQLKNDINSSGYLFTEAYHHANKKLILEDLKKMKSVELKDGKFLLKFPAWLSEYLVIHVNDFYPSGERRTGLGGMYALHSRKEDFAKYLILSQCILFNCAHTAHSIFDRLLENLPPQEKFLLSLVLSDKFTGTPFHEDHSGLHYAYGISLAEKAWRNYYNYFQELPVSFEAFGITFGLKDKHLCPKPFHSLYNLMSNAVNRVSFLDTSPEDVAAYVKKLMDKPPGEAYRADFDIFLSKFGELQSRYNFYCQITDQEGALPLAESPYIQLLHAVETQIFVLLPLVDEQSEPELPSFDLGPYREAPLEAFHLDLHFLLILLCVHNCYYCDKESRELIRRSDYDPHAIDFGKKVLRSFETKLQESQRKPLNIKKNNYYNLYLTKHLFVIRLFEKCGIGFDSALQIDERDIKEKFEFVLEKFKFLGDYFGIVDTLFWSIWFMTRLSRWTPGINKLIKEILLNIDDFLGYIHFNTGLMYMGIISNTVITPYKAYQMTNKFLSKNKNIPRFLEYDFLINLHTVCYNGEFGNRAALRRECLDITDRLFTHFLDKMDPSTRNRINLAKVSLLFHDLKENGPQIEQLLGEIKPQDLEDENRGLYYYRYIQYLREKKDYAAIKELSLYEKAKKHLKSHKFYYIQFLRECVIYLDQALNQSRHDEMVEAYKKKIDTYNEIRENLLESEKDNPGIRGFQVDQKEHRINTLNILAKEIDELQYQLLNRQESTESLRELKLEFEEYHKNFRSLQMISGSENLPAKYLLANTAEFLGRVTHNQLSLNDSQVEPYYNTALDLFFELKEYIPFLRILLELKILYSYNEKKQYKKGELSTLGKKAMYIVNYLKQEGGMLDIESANKEAQEISCLLYDFFNPNVSSSDRTDYHFEIGLPQKIDKVNTGYKKDGDTRGFRKYLASFHYNYHNQAPVPRLLIDLKHVFEHAEHHADRLTLDDLNTLDKVLPKLERRIDGQDIGHTVELTQLGDRLRALKETYYNFVQEKLAALK